VLSELAGAAQELTDAVIISPYDIDGFAKAINRAIEMPRGQRRDRMLAMRKLVAGKDVFSWASEILEALDKHGSVTYPGVARLHSGTGVAVGERN